MIKRVLVHGLCVAGMLWCLSMIVFIPAWYIRLWNAFFLMAFVAVLVMAWQHKKEAAE